MSEKSVRKSVIIEAVPALVWNALTQLDLLKRWMSDTDIDITAEWRIGGSFVVTGNANGNYGFKGSILELKPERILKYSSWTRISRLPDVPKNYAIIEFRLAPIEYYQTQLTLTHSNLIALTAIEHSNFYWDVALSVLKELVEELSAKKT